MGVSIRVHLISTANLRVVRSDEAPRGTTSLRVDSVVDNEPQRSGQLRQGSAEWFIHHSWRRTFLLAGRCEVVSRP